MNIADQLITQLEQVAARSPLPRVRALHLPRPVAGKNKDAEFCALELESGALGLSYVLLDGALDQLLAGDHRPLQGLDALEVARWFRDAPDSRRTVGLAAINALTRHFFDGVGFCPDSSADSLGQVAPQAGDHIGMIGFFPPLIRKVLAAGAKLTVIELNPELAGSHNGYTVSLQPEDLRPCNKIVSTSTVLLNDTLDRMLSICSAAESFAMIGPSAGCLPDALFARGVTLLGGTWVLDHRGFVDALHEGQPWSAHTRKCALDKYDYPGFDALLQRL